MASCYVDGSKATNGNGSFASPFNRFKEALAAAVLWSDDVSTIFVRAVDDDGEEIVYREEFVDNEGTPRDCVMLIPDVSDYIVVEPWSGTPFDRRGKIVLDGGGKPLTTGVKKVAGDYGRWTLWNIEVRNVTGKAIAAVPGSYWTLHAPRTLNCGDGIYVPSGTLLSPEAVNTGPGSGAAAALTADQVLSARVLNPSCQYGINGVADSEQVAGVVAHSLVSNHSYGAGAIGIAGRFVDGCTVRSVGVGNSRTGIKGGVVSDSRNSVINCIVDGYYTGCKGVDGGDTEVRDCLIHGATVRTVAGTHTGRVTEINVVTSDPMFVDPANHNYAVFGGSPAARMGPNGSPAGCGGVHPIAPAWVKV